MIYIVNAYMQIGSGSGCLTVVGKETAPKVVELPKSARRVVEVLETGGKRLGFGSNIIGKMNSSSSVVNCSYAIRLANNN